MTEAEREMKAVSRRSFLWAGASVVAGYGAFRFLSQGDAGKASNAARAAFEWNERVFDRFTGPQQLAQEYDFNAISTDAKVNGRIGLGEVPTALWKLEIEGLSKEPTVLTLDALKACAAIEMAVELNCIEGWTRVMRWKGARLSEVVRLLLGSEASASALPTYVAFETPRATYYTGLHTKAALHPQSLLAYELNGSPVPTDHGGPVRHILPTLYGYKQLKHVGRIKFTLERPRDYWAERGYDWYGQF